MVDVHAFSDLGTTMENNVKQVLDRIDKLQKVADALRSQEVAEVVGCIKVAIARYNPTPDELFGDTTKQAQTPKQGGEPKY